MIGFIVSAIAGPRRGPKRRQTGPDTLQRYIEARCLAQVEREFLIEEMAAAERKADYYRTQLSA